MFKLLTMFVKQLAMLAAVCVILLAIAVGAFRLLLPQLPTYQGQIKSWAQDALGVRVDFSRLDARWGLQGPELTFFDARVGGSPETPTLAAERASIGISLLGLMTNRELLVDRVTLLGIDLLLERDPNGQFTLQQQPLVAGAGSRGFDLSKVPGFQIRVRDSRMRYVDHGGSDRDWEFANAQVDVSRNAERVLLVAQATLPDTLGNSVSFSAEVDVDQSVSDLDELQTGPWRIVAEFRDIDLAGWSQLSPEPLGVLPDEGRGDVSLWVEFSQRQPIRGTLQVALDDVVLPQQRVSAVHGDPYEQVRLVAEWAREAEGWRVGLTDLVISRAGRRWPISNADLKLRLDAGEAAALALDVGFLRLEDLTPIAHLLPDPAAAQLWLELDPTGDLRQLNLLLERIPNGSWNYTVEAGLEAVGIAAYRDWPGIRGVTADLRADATSGSLDLNTADAEFRYPAVFEEPLSVASLSGILVWRQGRGGLRFVGDDIAISSPDFAVRSSLELTVPADGSSPVLEIDAGAVGIDALAGKRYLPVGKMPAPVVSWLKESVLEGEVTRARLSFFGPIRAFPFDNGEGQFRVEGSFQNGRLRFAPGWPTADNISGEVVFSNARLDGRVLHARILDHVTGDTVVGFEDLRTGVLTIAGTTEGPLQDVLTVLKTTPVTRARMGDQLQAVSAPSGSGRLALDIVLPVKSLADYELYGGLTLVDGELALDGLEPTFTALNGRLTLAQDDVSGKDIAGQFLGSAVIGSVTPLRDDSYRSQLSWSGPLTSEALKPWLPDDLAQRVSGITQWRVDLLLPKVAIDPASAPTRIRATSDLMGLGLELPAPFNKRPEESLNVAAELSLGPAEAILEGYAGTLGRFLFGFTGDDAATRLSRGNLRFGDSPPILPAGGLVIDGQLLALTVDDWIPILNAQLPVLRGSDISVASDLYVADLQAFGQRLETTHLVATRHDDHWRVEVDSEPVLGTITIPAQLGQRPQLVLDMQRLQLVAGTGEDPLTIDPRELPGAVVVARDFAIGERQFGELNADISADPLGLTMTTFATDAGIYSIKGAGRWSSQAGSQSTHLAMELLSSDVGASLVGLGSMQGMIDGATGQLTADVSWRGSPTADWAQSLAGEVSISMDDGSVNAIEPGAGRVVGLMSIAALPRRLELDFRDVFQKGLRFDKVRGSFLVVDGDAYTNNLKLEGPVAEIGIVGRTGLKDRDYQQQAVVTAEAGKVLPAVGGILAGPGVGAALLLFTQIFKESLKGMGRASYCVTGSWDEPLVERLTPSELADGPLCADLPPESNNALANQDGPG